MALLLGLLIAVPIGWWAARWVTRPLRAARDAAHLTMDEVGGALIGIALVLVAPGVTAGVSTPYGRLRLDPGGGVSRCGGCSPGGGAPRQCAL